MSSDRLVAAQRAVACLDLTSLNDGDTDTVIEALCAKATTPVGPAAAVCVWPRFVPLCQRILGHSEVNVCTVVNFPHGRAGGKRVRAETRAAIADGADEIDVVLPYAAQLSGREADVRGVLDAARQATGDRTLKVILETGRLITADAIDTAAGLAIEAGADFLKTSTGKAPISATLASTHRLLDAAMGASRLVGVKAAGGVRTTNQALAYLRLADMVMKTTVGPDRFRFGASGLLNDLLAALGGGGTPAATTGY